MFFVHWYVKLAPVLADNFTLSPLQNDVGPPAVTFAMVVFAVTDIAFDDDVHPNVFVTFTE